MAEFINYIIDSPIQPVKTNVLWVKKGVLHYYNKKWIPIAGGGSGNITYPIIDGEGNYSAVLAYSDNKALNISSIALGYNNISRNFAEASFGKYNSSHESDDSSIATLFSIGNGSKEERKNAFEIKENGDIYIGGRVESLQSILFRLENPEADTKYDSLLKKYEELQTSLNALDSDTQINFNDVYSKIEANTNSISDIYTKVEKHSIDIIELQDYLKTLKNHIDVSNSKLESTFEKYKTDVDGALIEMSTSITQTAEEIRLEAEKTKKELDGKITEYEASFSVTAEEIRAEVSRVETDLDGKIVEANSSISQTADAIRAEVTRVETDITGKITESNSLIEQTASAIRQEVSSLEKDINGSIKEANSKIEQTANSITSEVYEIEKTLDGKIEENKSSIEQTSEKIESTVEALTVLDGKVLIQESKINQTAGSIELLVTEVESQGSKIEENTANIEINKNAITSKVEKDDFDALSSAVEETGKEFTEVKQTVSGIETTIQDQTGKVTRIEETVTGLVSKTGTLEAEIQTLKNQSDGAIETHFGKVAPTLDNEPAVNWDTEALKKEHTGDLYYNNTTGEAFRWSYDPETGTYLWVELTDSALTDALEKISKLEVAIDGKVTIFYNEPSNYKEGDIWFVHNDNYSEFKFVKGQLLTAISANTIFSGEDWEDKTNFASHAEVETAANNLDNYIRGAFLDQTLTVAEVAQIKESKKTFDSLIAEVEESYKYLIVSAVATESDKTKLEQAYNKLLSEEIANEGSYILLVQAINNLLALDKEEGDDIINLDEAKSLLTAYDKAYNTFLVDLKAFYDATNALTENVQAHLNEASKYIENIVSDGVLSPIEKKQLFDIWRQIKEEFIANRGIAVNYKIIKLDKEGNYVKNEELYNDKDYFDIYEAYLNNYLPLEGIFIGSDWGFNDLNIASPTPEGYNTEYIATSFNNYYNVLTPFAEMIAEITIAITDAHDKAIALANKLQEHLDPKDEISVIGKGVILSSIIGVKKSDDETLVSAINAQALNNEEIVTTDETHGRVVYAGGIPFSNNWNDSTTVIYEDGHVKFKSGEISDNVSIGDNRQNILDTASKIKDSLQPGEQDTLLSNGLVLSTIIGVKDSKGNVKAAINASDTYKDLSDSKHGKIVFVGGIDNENWNNSTVVIYEDGHVKLTSGDIGDSVSIGETRQAILNKANTLQESLGVGGNTVIDGGLVLSTLLGVVDTEGNLKSVLNASDISKDTVNNHGRIVFAGGIENSEDWTTAKTIIYEDGYFHFKAGKIDDSVELGTAFIRSVAQSDEIDVLSYPQNGTLIPLFQINKDSQGNIISLSVLYDFIANKNVIVHGDTSTGGPGEDTDADGTLIGVKVGDNTYAEEYTENGILNLTEAFNAIDVSDQLANYLPKRGGTISGNLSVDGNFGLTGYINTRSHYLFVRNNDNAEWVVTNKNWNSEYTLLHSGNVGEYAGTLVDQKSYDLNEIREGFRAGKLFGAENAANADASYRGFLEYGVSGYVAQFNSDSNNLYYRWCENNVWKDWKTVAFTDSNITGKAAGLQHKDASMGNYYLAPYTYGFSLEGQYASLRIKSTNVYNSQVEFADNNDITRWSLSYRGANKADKDFHIVKIEEDGTWDHIAAFNYSSGNVGIGTINPSTKLHILGSSTYFATPVGLTENNATGASWYAVHAFTNPNMNVGEYAAIQIGKKLNEKNCGHLSFYYVGDSSADNRLALGFYNVIDLLVVKASGNVGIGTTDPAVKLETKGDITARDVSSTTGRFVTAENALGHIGIYASTNRGVYDFSTSTWLIATNGSTTWLSRGNVAIDNGLSVSGVVTMSSTLSVSGKTTISNDLVVSGDVASGGSGESTDAVGTITGVNVNGFIYGDDYISAGILDLTDAFNAIDVSDQLANYLPLSGGTISGRFKVGDYIQFTRLADSNTYLLGQPYADDATKLSFYDGSAWRVILHSGNYSSYALPKSGGTMTGALTISTNGWNNQIVLNGVDSNAGIQFKYSNALMGSLYAAQNELYWLKGSTANKMWHAGNFNPADYLPLSGGTIYSEAYTPLTLKRNANYGLAISFQNNLGFLGEIGVNANGSAIFADATATHTLLHSGNYSSYALPLSGGTIDVATGTIFNASYADDIFGYNDYYGTYIGGKAKTGGSWKNDYYLYSGNSAHPCPNFYMDGSRYDLLHNGNYATEIGDYYLKSSGGTISGDTDALKILRNTNGYSAITYYNTQNGATTLLGVMGFDSNGEPSAYRASDNAWRTILHSGNYSSYALPLSGGTIEGGMGVLNIKRNVANFSSISFENTSGLMGYLGFYRADQPAVRMSDNTTTHLLIHSGNIGSQSVANAAHVMVNYLYNRDEYMPILMTGRDSIGTAINNFVATDFLGQLTYNPKQNILKAGTFDGNATSATKLQTARTIWGQSFDGTANINGDMYLENEKPIHIKDANGKYQLAIHMSASNNLWIGNGTSAAGYNTLIAGYNTIFRTGGNSNTAMTINSSGNVTIGGEDLAGTSAKLYVNGNIKTDGYIQFSSLGNDTFTITSIENTASGLIIERARTENSHKASIIPLIISQRGGGTAAMFYGDNFYVAGNVGIGTTDPSTKLHVFGSSKDFSTPIGLTENSATGNSWYAIHAFTTPNMNTGEYAAILFGKKNNIKNIGHISFYYAGDSSDDNRLALGFRDVIDLLVVKANGNVGIGTPSPAYKLDVAGTGRFTGAVTMSSTLSVGGNIKMGDNTHLDGGSNHLIFTSPNYTVFGMASKSSHLDGSEIYLRTSGATAVTIASNGAVTMSNTLSVGSTTINGGLELFYDTPYIDFHFGKSSADYTSRIIEDEAGKIRLIGELRVNGQTTLYNNLVVEGDGSFAAGLNCLDFSVSRNAYIPNIEWQKMYGLRPNTNANALIGYFENAPILLSQSGTLRLGKYDYDSNAWCQFTFNSSTKNLTIGPADNFAFTTTIDGNLVVTGDTSTGSDIRFKDKLSDHRIALSDIANAPLFTFKWNDREDDTIHLGSSAQYWEKVTPWLVKGEDFKTLDYSTLGVAMGISLAKKAVNHEERIKELERKVKSLEEENRRLRYGN